MRFCIPITEKTLKKATVGSIRRQPTQCIRKTGVALLVASGCLFQSASADIGTVDSAARLMTYFYSVDEIANHCRVNAPSAAPGLEDAYELWRSVNIGKVQQIQRRLQQVLAADLGVSPASADASDELQANLRETRNTTARLLRRNLERLTDVQLRDQCARLAQNLSTNASLIDRHLAGDWNVLFVARPASPADAIGTWSTAADCGGERWTLRADGQEALSEIDPAAGEDTPYGYRGEWSVVDGLYRSVGVEHSGARLRLIGNLQATVDGRELRLTITRQGVRQPGEDESTLSDPGDIYTVAYQRCSAETAHPHPAWDVPAAAPTIALPEAGITESIGASDDANDTTPNEPIADAQPDSGRGEPADRRNDLPRRGPRR